MAPGQHLSQRVGTPKSSILMGTCDKLSAFGVNHVQATVLLSAPKVKHRYDVINSSSQSSHKLYDELRLQRAGLLGKLGLHPLPPAPVQSD